MRTRSKLASESWRPQQRILHAVIGVCLPIMLGLGFISQANLWHQYEDNGLLTLHQVLGIIVLFMACCRIYYRSRYGRPPWSSHIQHWQKKLAQMVHGALYLLPLILPVSGMLLSYLDPFLRQPINMAADGDGSTQVAIAQQGAAYQLRLENMNINDDVLIRLDLAHSVHYFCAWLLIFCIVLHVAAALMHSLRKKTKREVSKFAVGVESGSYRHGE